MTSGRFIAAGCCELGQLGDPEWGSFTPPAASEAGCTVAADRLPPQACQVGAGHAAAAAHTEAGFALQQPPQHCLDCVWVGCGLNQPSGFTALCRRAGVQLVQQLNAKQPLVEGPSNTTGSAEILGHGTLRRTKRSRLNTLENKGI